MSIARQAITTKFIGPSNTKGSRVKAKSSAGSLTIHWNHSMNTEENHTAAARAFATKWDWKGVWFIGGLPDTGYVFVNAGLRENFDEPVCEAFVIE
jgi:hypothetical protein